MTKTRLLLRQFGFGMTIIVQGLFFPALALNNQTTQAATACPTAYGTTRPTGSDAHTFTFNSTSCLWENQYYTWNPASKARTALYPQEYAYNPDTGRQERTRWVYSPAAGKYIDRIQVLPEPPAPVVPPSEESQTSPNTIDAPDSIGSSNLLNSQTKPGYTNTAPNQSAVAGISGNAPQFSFDAAGNVIVSNTVNTGAYSGDAGVQSNTSGGNAASGDTQAIANILNLLQSSWNPSQGELVTFQQNIDGDVLGDLHIDPLKLSSKGLGAGQAADVDVTIANDGRINNTVVVDAASGNAGITGNTNAGSASTGAADAVANIINLMNSAISAGDSFIGTLNINGNLDGDILLPPDFIDQLLASNTPTATLNTAQLENGQLLADVTDNQAISNTVTTTAKSGTAAVAGNTNGGAATTGNTQTNVTLFNLTGRQVVADNALLVFVNVLGEWVGLIMDAPAGTTAAALGGGVSRDAAILDATITNSGTINNDVLVNAQSGDASLRHNTNAGNASTGDATASANIANIMGSQFSLSNWFGVLFINVFGSWNGSFGVNTAAGNPVLASAAAHKTLSDSDKIRVFQFVPQSSNSGETPKARLAAVDIPASGTHATNIGASLGSATNASDSHAARSASLPDYEYIAVNEAAGEDATATAAATAPGRDWMIPVLSTVTAFLLLAAERLVSLRGKRRQAAS